METSKKTQWLVSGTFTGTGHVKVSTPIEDETNKDYYFARNIETGERLWFPKKFLLADIPKEANKFGMQYIENPTTKEEFINNCQFQLDNTIGWMGCEKYDNALSKANCLIKALQDYISFDIITSLNNKP
jgi:hypothetical protein